MPGIPTQFKVLELTIDKLASSSDPALNQIAQVMKDNSQYAHLGALGPSLGDFIPAGPPVPGQPLGNQYVTLWSELFSVVAGDGTDAKPGLYRILTDMNEWLNRLTDIANDEDEDALMGFEDQVDDITKTAEDLKKIVEEISDKVVPIATTIGIGMRPRVFPADPSDPTKIALGDPIRPSESWEVRNFLHWKRPGAFLQALHERAHDETDPERQEQFLAYTYGYLISYVTKTVGSPFVNSIVGGPYRTQWWRYRWISNYIDAWVYGFYEDGASMSGDTPSPAYEDWSNLCEAQLQEKIELEGVDPEELLLLFSTAPPAEEEEEEEPSYPQVLPPEFGAFWVDAFNQAYDPPRSIWVKPEELNGAYLFAWLVLWFQTSGQVLGCAPAPPDHPGDDCGEDPSWTNPAADPADADGSGSSPPEPEIETSPDAGKIISGIIAALLGIVSFAGGGWAAGAAAIAGGISLFIDGLADVNWSKLRCDIYWYKLYVYHGLEALHEVLTLGAFAYPYAPELGVDSDVAELMGFEFPYDSGKNVVKSKNLQERFPAKPWGGLPSLWTMPPTGGTEGPEQVAYLASAYPSHFIDAAGTTGKVRENDSWPIKLRPDGFPLEFDDAVDNAVDLFAHLDEGFPDWNLDADRGLAFHTWSFEGDVYTDPVAIEPED